MILFPKVLLTLSVLLISACSIMPYESDFGCKLKDNFGRCATMQESYEEAVTGVPQGEKIVPVSQRGFGHKKQSGEEKVLNNVGFKEAGSSAYPTYRDSVYSELTGLIEKPRTPMLRPPKTFRTLILSYAPESKKTVLYMPRYVYSILEDPEWVIGNYIDYKNKMPAGIADSGGVSK